MVLKINSKQGSNNRKIEVSYSDTNLGLALLAQNDVEGAIHCLDSSWRVHPCPHNTSFGLDRRLVSKLRHLPKAEKIVEGYINIGKKFVYWPEGWVEKISGHNKSVEQTARR
jgi:hypothetical protein